VGVEPCVLNIRNVDSRYSSAYGIRHSSVYSGVPSPVTNITSCLFSCSKYATLQSLVMDGKSTENTVTIYTRRHHTFANSSWVVLHQSIRLYWTNPSIFVRPVFVVVWTEKYAIMYHIFTYMFRVICVFFELVHKINFGCSFSSSHVISLWKNRLRNWNCCICRYIFSDLHRDYALLSTRTAIAHVSCRQSGLSFATVTFMKNLACPRLSAPAVIVMWN